MTLSDFEQFMDDLILYRGLNYYKEGRVDSLDLTGGKWTAEVIGAKGYCVTAKLSENGDILSSRCDCPYEFGEYCKHQAALFYALRDRLKRRRVHAQETDLQGLLLSQTKEMLAAILLEYANRDELMNSDLRLRFSEPAQMVQHARKLIKNSVRRVMRKGFVEYGFTGQAVKGAERVLKLAENMPESGQLTCCVRLLIVLLEEMMRLLDNCDDSNGIVGGVICQAIEIFRSAISGMGDSFGEKAEIFRLITGHAQSPAYDGWSDWRLELLEICVPLCKDRALRKQLESFLGGCCADEYEKSRMQNIQAHIIAVFDGEDAADEYRSHRLDNSDFRRITIEKNVSQGRWDEALKLCLEGEASDADYPGLLYEWRAARYSVYEHTGDIPAQIQLARSLVLDGNFEYYRKLKLLYPVEKWPGVLDELLAEFKRLKGTSQEVYVKILIAENLKDLLLAYCRQKTWMLLSLYEHLIPDYTNEMVPLFQELIMKEADMASDRKSYRAVCEIIRHFRGACGNFPAKEMIGGLLDTYKKRPAFVDELKKC